MNNKAGRNKVMAMHSGAWTEKFSYPLRQYMTAISPRSLWWKTDADFHHQESVEQTNSWDNISFDPNLQHLQDQRQRGGGHQTLHIYTSHLPANSEDHLPPPKNSQCPDTNTARKHAVGIWRHCSWLPKRSDKHQDRERKKCTPFSTRFYLEQNKIS